VARHPLHLHRQVSRRPSFTSPALPGASIGGQLVGIGENYRAPEDPRSRAEDRVPLVFGKFAGSLTGHEQPITVDEGLTGPVVCEGELAVVMGAVLHKAAGPRQALAAVAGLTVANDVSAREIQAADVQSTRGKSLDGFCPLGPELVTLDEIPELQALRIRTLINGQVVQDASTADMVFTVAELLVFCSGFMTLYPGDVLLTGTPWVPGDEQLRIRPGDEVSVEIPGVGVLRNPVVGP
jgi:2-keto-4-pentenoate hydratase/2-oxohepta-3-ene-1,7-dioic acid hydratase in catechol pathway